MRYGLHEFEGGLVRQSFSFNVLVVICRTVSLVIVGGVVVGRKVVLIVGCCVWYRSDMRKLGDWGALSIKAGELETWRYGA
jgi:hypothetical protein